MLSLALPYSLHSSRSFIPFVCTFLPSLSFSLRSSLTSLPPTVPQNLLHSMSESMYPSIPPNAVCIRLNSHLPLCTLDHYLVFRRRIIQPLTAPRLQTKVEEFTGRAMTAQGHSQMSKKDDAVRTLELKSRTLDARAIGDVAEHLVVPSALKQVIVDVHNRLRASVMPRAIDMETMVRSPHAPSLSKLQNKYRILCYVAPIETRNFWK